MKKPKKVKKIVPLEALKDKISKNLLFGIISRKELEKRTGGLLKRGTLANWDSKGKGPKRKIKTGRDAAYYVCDVIELMEKRFYVEQRDD